MADLKHLVGEGRALLSAGTPGTWVARLDRDAGAKDWREIWAGRSAVLRADGYQTNRYGGWESVYGCWIQQGNADLIVFLRNNAETLFAAAEELAERSRSDYPMLTIEDGKVTLLDDPMLDGTDAAHPAWWRAHDNTFAVTVRMFSCALTEPRHNGRLSDQVANDVIDRIHTLREDNERLRAENAKLLDVADDLARDLAAEEESHAATVKRRDEMEDAFNQAYALVTGRDMHWSNFHHIDQALSEIEAVV